MTHPIVVCYDGSACSEDALAAAVDLVAATGDELLIVYCHEVPAGLSCELDPACPAAKERRDFERHVEEDVQPLLDRAVDEARSLGARAEGIVAWGDGPAALCRVAGEREARLIVVGSHGQSIVGALLSRSPCYRLVQDSSLPVLVVHSQRCQAFDN